MNRDRFHRIAAEFLSHNCVMKRLNWNLRLQVRLDLFADWPPARNVVRAGDMVNRAIPSKGASA